MMLFGFGFVSGLAVALLAAVGFWWWLTAKHLQLTVNPKPSPVDVAQHVPAEHRGTPGPEPGPSQRRREPTKDSGGGPPPSKESDMPDTPWAKLWREVKRRAEVDVRTYVQFLRSENMLGPRDQPGQIDPDVVNGLLDRDGNLSDHLDRLASWVRAESEPAQGHSGAGDVPPAGPGEEKEAA